MRGRPQEGPVRAATGEAVAENVDVGKQAGGGGGAWPGRSHFQRPGAPTAGDTLPGDWVEGSSLRHPPHNKTQNRSSMHVMQGIVGAPFSTGCTMDRGPTKETPIQVPGRRQRRTMLASAPVSGSRTSPEMLMQAPDADASTVSA